MEITQEQFDLAINTIAENKRVSSFEILDKGIKVYSNGLYSAWELGFNLNEDARIVDNVFCLGEEFTDNYIGSEGYIKTHIGVILWNRFDNII